MSGLLLKLAPKERVLINGAVIENGDRRSRLSIVTPNANILRLKDAIHPEDANTPVRRACYIAQLLISGDADSEKGKEQLNHAIDQLSKVLRDEDCRNLLNSAREALSNFQTYKALKSLRGLLPYEEKLLKSSGSLAS